jgi:hypothetical protein
MTATSIFVSTRSYEQTQATIYRARFHDGVAGAPELVEGVSRRKAGWVNFDAEISADGNTLYFVDGYFGSAGKPLRATLTAAARSGQSFRRLDASERLFARINSNWLQYAPHISADEPELFFTRVKRIEPSAIQGFAEASSTLSPDGRSPYYHARGGSRFHLRRVRRD